MYQDFFGFREMPFNITPNPRFLFLSPTHQEALQHLRYGIEQKKGFIALTGEVGCGKTTLCRQLLNELDPERYETALIVNPRLSEEQLLSAILTELGWAGSVTGKNDLIQELNLLLLGRIKEGKDIVLVIDEAHNLEFEVMEQLRLLSNLETDDQKLLQIILMGQPELRDNLMEERLRQLRERILVYYELKPLNRYETRMYVQHRLSLVGSMGRPRFTNWAFRALYRGSHGIPRRINNICDKALLSAFIRSTDLVSYHDIRRAVKDIDRLR
ncbi:MAG TPA: ATPase [Lentisphaeria bacterium]|nr:ATPase [Lentisphaeria bacterium]